MVIFKLTEHALKTNEPFNEAISEIIIEYIEHKMSVLTHSDEMAYNNSLDEFVEDHSSESFDNFIRGSNTYFPFYMIGEDAQVSYKYIVEYIDNKPINGSIELHESFDCFGGKEKWLK